MFREDLELTLNMCSRQKESYVCLFKKERWIVTHVWAQDNGSHAQSLNFGMQLQIAIFQTEVIK